MTEDEARTKWCPFVQVAIDGEGTRIVNNRGRVIKNNDSTGVFCVGSECMMWREIRKQTTPSTPDEVLGGYCGLAGKPT